MTKRAPSSPIPEYEFQNLGTFMKSFLLSAFLVSLPQEIHNYQWILKASTGAAELPPQRSIPGAHLCQPPAAPAATRHQAR